MTISFTINGEQHSVTDDAADVKLLDYMHEMMSPRLTGTKFCCGMGVCRACTVAMTKSPNPNAEPIVSCSTALSTIDGADITTIEGVSDGTDLHPIQTAFLKNFAFQCGYCTPGFVMASKIFLDWLASATLTEDQLDAAIADAIGDHICRCTGYVRYHEALRETALAVIKGETAQ